MDETPERPLALVLFYCHMCNVEFQNADNDFTCPRCSEGFVEELTRQETPSHSRQHEGVVYTTPNMEGRYRDFPRPLTRLASSNLRQQLPLEHLVHDFIINLGVGANMGTPGNVQLFLGNPGDYAWGREGLDAVVTQLLNQMDSAGPPPATKAVIEALKIVEVSHDQVGQNLQCSVCWEDFSLKEPVRELPCLHIYHELCIMPWLQLHGTCPICRQNLGHADGANPQGNGEENGGVANQQDNGVLTLPNLLRSLFAAELPTGSSPSNGEPNNPPPDQMDQSGNNSSSPSSDDADGITMADILY